MKELWHLHRQAQCNAEDGKSITRWGTKEVIAIAEAFQALEQRAEAAEERLELVREQRDSELNRNTELEAALAEEKRTNSKLRQDRADLSRECNAFEANLLSMNKQMSHLERTGIEERDRRVAAEAELRGKTVDLECGMQLIKRLERQVLGYQAKLAELDNQEPVAWMNTREGDPTWPRVYSNKEKADENRAWVTLNPMVKTQPLFTRPAPAVSLAELVPPKKSTDIDYAYYPLSKARHEGYNECVDDILRNIEGSK